MYNNSGKPNLQSPLILFATPPPLDQLRAITVRLSSNLQSMARFQPQVIKCREFIFTEPEIIGTPSADINEHHFHLVTQVSLMNSGKLQTRISRIGLQASKPFPVSEQLYESCLRYTILARLSPTWNKAGPWLIQGRDFLTHRGCANAVKMDVNVHKNELFFTLEAAALKLSPLQVTDLDIMGKHLEQFLKNPAAQIGHSSIASDWCFILPSMKRGRIVNISHDIPEDSPFMTYRDLKRHWKNTYGYRLPENEDDVNFYQINFGRLGGKLFTYPEVCLRGRELQRMARVDPKPILRAFMLELQSKFPTVCGCPLKLQSKAKFPVADLFPSRQDTVKGQPNLTNKMNSSKPALYRSKDEMERLMAPKQPAQVPVFNNTKPAFRSDCPVQGVHGNSNIANNNNSSVRNIETGSHLETSKQDNNKSDANGAKQQNNSSLRNLPDSYINTVQGNIREISQQNVTSNTEQRNISLNSHWSALHGIQAKASNKVTFNTSSGSSRPVYTPSSAETPILPSKASDLLAGSRKIVPLFKPKKLLPQIEAEAPCQASTEKIIPVFHPQKKSSLPSTLSKSKPVSNVHKPFIPLISTQAIRNDVIAPTFQTSVQKVMPSFSSTAVNKSVPSFKKLETSAMTGSSVSKKDQKKEKATKEKKEQKDKKTVKRSKAPKNDPQQSKKAKLLKAEA